MNPDEIYLYLSSKDSKSFHPNNTTADFRVYLPRTLNLDESWSVALVEINFSCDTPTVSEVNIYSSITQHRLVGCEEIQLLARIDAIKDNQVSKQIENPIYLPVSLEDLSEVKISIRNDSGDAVYGGDVTLILHLKKSQTIMNQTILLKSSDCLDIFPSNRPTNFTVRLPYELTFTPDEYEVGLLNIAFTKSIFTEKIGYLSMQLNGTSKAPFKSRYKDATTIKYHHALELNDLAQLINRASDELAEESREITLPVKYSVDKGELKVSQIGAFISEADGSQAHFEYAFDVNLRSFIAGKVPKPETLDNIYVHCSIVEPSIVGDTFAPILRVININHVKNGERVYFDFERPYYCTLSDYLVRDIEISLKNYSNSLLHFHSSDPVIVTLEIRRKSSLD